MYDTVPFVYLSGISRPSFIVSVIRFIGAIAHFLVALYASPGFPSLSCDFLSAMFLRSRPMSRSAYSWLSHDAVSGSACMILAGAACCRMFCSSSLTCVSSFSNLGHVCVLFLA